ncbi:MAG: hypothetical protein ACNA74_04500 [Desulfurivibrio sp.]
MDSLKKIGSRLNGPGNLSLNLAVVALVYALLTFLLALYFVLSRPLPPGPALLVSLAALPLGGFFGLALLVYNRRLAPFAHYLRRVVPGSAAAFLLLFSHIIGYVLLFSGLVSYPLGVIAGQGAAAPAMALDFRLYSINFVLTLALLSWLEAEHLLIARARTSYRRWRYKETS